MTIEEYFDKYPIKEPKVLTKDDLEKVYNFVANALDIYNPSDESLSKEEKIDSYKAYCRKEIEANFTELNVNGIRELDIYFNIIGTSLILDHLSSK